MNRVNELRNRRSGAKIRERANQPAAASTPRPGPPFGQPLSSGRRAPLMDLNGRDPSLDIR